MSSLLVLGFFGVGAGRRVSQQKPGSKKIYHCFYTTSFPSTGDADQRYPAEIRVYSRFNDTVLPDNSVVFIVAKGFFVLHEPILLEATTFVPVPGDPTDTSYDNNVPDLTTPLIIGLGVVPTPFEILSDGKSKTCTVVSSDYVRDVIKQSSIQCFFDDTRGRWSKTPMPNVNSSVQYYGSFAGHHGGLFRVCVESVALNVGHLELTPGSSTASSSAKRKWAAFASPTEAVASGSSDAPLSTVVQPSAASADVEVFDNDVAGVSQAIQMSHCDSQFAVQNMEEGVAMDPSEGRGATSVVNTVTVPEAVSTGRDALLQPLGSTSVGVTTEVSQQVPAMIGQPSIPGVTMTPSIYSFLANYAMMAAQPGSSTQLPVTLGSAQVSSPEQTPSIAGTVGSDGQLMESKSKGKRRARHG
ncbi:hypothetical protein JVT61DRAFT_10621 [Boletus reticuloceps]|uniref:Uncharacterized protein n=1 Tax=Boletus reticuloceps TaxID=495285 RepID=A0A8I2YFS6_9AGAM|nr:hypothetical protein JVT61DRAFT_10621 [Boletus reticuloceps]